MVVQRRILCEARQTFFSRGSAVHVFEKRDTKFYEPMLLNTPLLITVGPNSGDDIVIMLSGA